MFWLSNTPVKVWHLLVFILALWLNVYNISHLHNIIYNIYVCVHNDACWLNNDCASLRSGYPLHPTIPPLHTTKSPWDPTWNPFKFTLFHGKTHLKHPSVYIFHGKIHGEHSFSKILFSCLNPCLTSKCSWSKCVKPWNPPLFAWPRLTHFFPAEFAPARHREFAARQSPRSTTWGMASPEE